MLGSVFVGFKQRACLNMPQFSVSYIWRSHQERFQSPDCCTLQRRNSMSASQAASAELLGWLNQLLKLNYTKVEQCGSGGAYCQIIDSIDGVFVPTYESFVHTKQLLGNFPMYRVNMNANNEYEYIANFKLLALYFKERKIEKACFCLSWLFVHMRLLPCSLSRWRSWLSACFSMLRIFRILCAFLFTHVLYSHNFEFLQWMKRYWEGNNGGNEYDAVARRGGALATDTPGSEYLGPRTQG